MTRYKFVFLPSIVMILLSCGQGKSGKEGADAPVDSVATRLGQLNERILASPADASLFAERAALQLQRDSLSLAVNDYKRAIALDSLEPKFHMALADLYFGKVRLPEAESYLRNATRLAPSDPEPKLKLAELKLFQKKYQESMDLVNDALRLEQGRAKGYHIKGFIYQETGDTAKAISSYQTATEQDPEFIDPWLQLALLHAERGDKLALDCYNTALEIQPNNVQALYGKGMYAQEAHMDSIALSCYDRIRSLDPKNPLPWYNTGYVMLVNQNRTKDARSQFSKAIQLMPNYAQAYYNRGLAYEIDGELDSAYLDFKKALTIEPAFTLAAEGVGRLGSKGVKVSR